MSSLVGHALGAMTVWEVGRRRPAAGAPSGTAWFVLPAALALAPDADAILPMVFPWARGLVHRGPTHSILAALLLAAAATGVARLAFAAGRGRTGGLFVLIFACSLTHPVMDALMGRGRAIPFLWPLADQGWSAPVQLLPTAYFARTPAGLRRLIFEPRRWRGMALEGVILGPLWLAVRAARWRTRLALAAIAAAGLAATVSIYN